jgi:hypothetical protein
MARFQQNGADNDAKAAEHADEGGWIQLLSLKSAGFLTYRQNTRFIEWVLASRVREDCFT